MYLQDLTPMHQSTSESQVNDSGLGLTAMEARHIENDALIAQEDKSA